MSITTKRNNSNKKNDWTRKNVKKGTLSKIESQIMKQDQRSEQIWEAWESKYERKESE